MKENYFSLDHLKINLKISLNLTDLRLNLMLEMNLKEINYRNRFQNYKMKMRECNLISMMSHKNMLI